MLKGQPCLQKEFRKSRVLSKLAGKELYTESFKAELDKVVMKKVTEIIKILKKHE